MTQTFSSLHYSSLTDFPQIFVLALAGKDVQICISADIYAEYEEVIRRPRFKRSESEIADALRAIREQGLWVKPSQHILDVPILMTMCFLSARTLRRRTFL